MTPKFLIAGHIVKDVAMDDWRPGGGVLYAAAQASKLGLEVAVVTACAEDIDPRSLLPHVTWEVQSSEVTTTFENTYEEGRRAQRLLASSRRLDFDALPEGWLASPIALLTPLFHEIEPEVVKQLTSGDALIGVAAQGWLRELAGDVVRPGAFEPSPAWLGGDVVFISDEDIWEADSVAAWREQVPVVALTRGRSGCTVWDSKGRHDISAVEASEADPTGAGDVFAAAFLVRYEETRDAVRAGGFAAAAGALSVRGAGFDSAASREEIEALLEQGRVKIA